MPDISDQQLTEVAAVAERALAAAESLSDPQPRAEALNGVARTLAEVGETQRAQEVAEQALAAAGKIEDKQSSVAVLREIARTLAKSGDTALVVVATEQALMNVEEIPDERSRLSALRELAPVLAEAGDVRQALAVAESISDQRWQAMAQRGVARALAQAGEADQALTLADAIADERQSAEALIDIAQVLTEIGNTEQALSIVDHVLATAETIRNGFGTADTRRALAVVLAQAGDRDRAVGLVGTIEHAKRKTDAFTSIAVALTQAGDTDGALTATELALEAAQAIDDAHWRVDSLTAIADAAAQSGDSERAVAAVEQALTTAEREPEAIPRADLLSRGALALADLGQTSRAAAMADEALATAETIEGEHPRSDALRSVAPALAAASKVDKALAVAADIPSESLRAAALRDIALVLARAGDTERALTVAESIEIEQVRAAALGRIVDAAARPAGARDILGPERDDLTVADDEEPGVELKQAAELFDDAAIAEVELAQQTAPQVDDVRQSKAPPPEGMPEAVHAIEIEELEFPGELQAGQRAVAKVHLRNAGTMAWEQGEKLDVAVLWWPGGDATGTPDHRWDLEQALDEDVAPGGTTLLTDVAGMAPAAPGDYAVNWLASGRAWDDQAEVAQVTVQVNVQPVRGYQAKVSLDGAPPAVMLPGEETTARLIIYNSGDTIWDATGGSAVVAGYRVFSEDPPGHSVEPPRQLLPTEVHPDEGVGLPLHFEAPQEPGIYRVVWDVAYDDDERWFSDHADEEPLSTRLEVVPLAALRSFLANLPADDRDRRIELIEAAGRAAQNESDPARRTELRDLIGQALFDDMATVRRTTAYALHGLRVTDPAVEDWLTELFADRQADLEPVVALTDWRGVSAEVREWLAGLLPAGLAEAQPEPQPGVEAPVEDTVAPVEEEAPRGAGRATEQAEPVVTDGPPDAGPFRRDPPAVTDIPAADDTTRTVVERMQTTIWNNVVRSAGRIGDEAYASDSRTLDIHIHPAYADQVAAAAANVSDGPAAPPGDGAGQASPRRRQYWVVLTLRERANGQEQPLRYFEGPLKLDELSPPDDREKGDYDIGRQLHRALFHADLPERYFTRDEPGTPTLRDGYARALEGATGEDGLRIQLRVHTDAVELHRYQWEYLVDATGQVRDPLACSPDTPLARILQVAGRGGQQAPTISRDRPLRILGALASPEELSWTGGLQADLLAGEEELAPIELAEIEALTQGLDRFPLIAPLEGDNLLTSPEDRVSVTALRRRLQQAHEQQGQPFHVLHLLCHGVVGADGASYVVLEREDSPRAALVPEDEFAELVRPFVAGGLRLVVFASCMTARPSHQHALQGVARRLVVEGVPAVVAMQHNIDYLTAQYFTQRLYPHLIHYGEIDRAVNAARRELWSHRRRHPRDSQPDRIPRFEWGIPVLFTRLVDGRLFRLDPAARADSDPDAEPEIVAYEDMPSGDVRQLMQRAIQAAGSQAGIAPSVDLAALAQAVAQVLSRPPAAPVPTEPEPEDRRLFTSPGQARRRHALLNAASEYRRSRSRRTVLFLRRQARSRIAQLVARDNLRRLTALQFREIWEGGGVDWPGDEELITEVLSAGPPAGLDQDHRLLSLGASEWRTRHRGFRAADGAEIEPIRLRGNLTWQADGRELAAGQQPDADDLHRLLYGDGDTFDVFDELTSDPDRHRRGLDEHTASFLQHAVAPGDYVPYHAVLADSVLDRLRLADNPDYGAGFRGYCELAQDLLADDDLGFEDLADVAYFLQRLAAGHLRWDEAVAGQPRTRIELQPVALRTGHIDSSLVLNPGVLDQSVAALNAGKHVILIGPPGTGKTTLAEDLCRLAHDGDSNRGHVLVTATADWTTFDTIGGYMPESGDRLVFRPGIFLDAIEAGKWLVIDEINRADIDKAFGELFTLLSGQAVTLPYRAGGRPVSIVPPGHPAPPGTRSYTIPASWRIIATMNVYDKASLFEMSYAFMRRFAFVDVTLPGSQPYQQLIRRFVLSAGLRAQEEDAVFSTLGALFDREPDGEANPLMQWRALGPAIAQDVVGYLAQRQPSDGVLDLGHLAEALLLYVVPQFDGLEPSQITDIYGHLTRTFADDKLRGLPEAELSVRRETLRSRRQALLQRIEELFPFIGRDDWDAV